MQSVDSPPNTQIDKGNQIYEGVFSQSLGFRIKMDHDAAMQFIRRIGGYNEFDPEAVIDALARIDRVIPRRYYGDGNPNNGERAYDISVGREGSPVIYLDLHEMGSEPKLDEPRLKAICNIARTDGLADEADVTTEDYFAFMGRKVTFRFWWD